VRNRYTGRRAVNRALRDWLTWVRVSWLRRLLPGPLSRKHYQVRVDARVLSAFPGNGHYRRAGNTWSHVSRAGTSSEKLVTNPKSGLRPWGRCTTEGLRHHDLDQSRSVGGTATWLQFLRLRPRGKRCAGFHPSCSRHPRTKSSGSMGAPGRTGWNRTRSGALRVGGR
jgi:hypothetical protein